MDKFGYLFSLSYSENPLFSKIKFKRKRGLKKGVKKGGYWGKKLYFAIATFFYFRSTNGETILQPKKVIKKGGITPPSFFVYCEGFQSTQNLFIFNIVKNHLSIPNILSISCTSSLTSFLVDVLFSNQFFALNFILCLFFASPSKCSKKLVNVCINVCP